MMKKPYNEQGFSLVAVLLMAAVLIFVGGAAWYVMQQNKDNDSSVVTSTQSADQTKQLQEPKKEETPKERVGIFTGVAPKTGSGTVTLIQGENNMNTVRLEDDFKVQNGPALYVSFGNNGTVDHETLFAELKAFEGKQEYQVPDTIDVSKYSQIFIYCEEFAVVFSVASLQ